MFGAVLLLSAAGCQNQRLDEQLTAAVMAEASAPSCAEGAIVTVQEGYDGLRGHDLAAEFHVTDDCKEIWWDALEQSSRFKCEQNVEYVACTIGSYLPGGNGLMVMPRKDDMLVLKRNGQPRTTK
jgi:hypothetical protein